MNSTAVHINEVVDRCHKTAVEHGFWDDADNPSLPTVILASLAPRIVTLGVLIEEIREGFASIRPDWVENNLSSTQRVLLSKLVLIVSEVAEAVEAVVAQNFDHLGEEIADITIRADDLSGYLQRELGIDPGEAKCRKMVVNEGRPYRHGKLA